MHNFQQSFWVYVGGVAGVLALLGYIARLTRKLLGEFRWFRRVIEQHEEMVVVAHSHAADGTPVALYVRTPKGFTRHASVE